MGWGGVGSNINSLENFERLTEMSVGQFNNLYVASKEYHHQNVDVNCHQ